MARLKLGLISPWRRAPWGRGVLNCYLGRPGTAGLRIFFRIGPVRGFCCVSGEFPVGLDGLDRLCGGGGSHPGFHLNKLPNTKTASKGSFKASKGRLPMVFDFPYLKNFKN